MCSRLLSGVLLALLAGGCGEPWAEEEPASPEAMGSQSWAIKDDNGLATNGLATNGLATNGLATNGLSLSTLNGSAFISWFNQDPALADMVMRYVVRCAVSPYSQVTWTNPVTSVQYQWRGSLGLTPSWGGGAPATEVEQQLITSCLAAHTNKYGANVAFSIQGLKANGNPLPVSDWEFYAFAQREACFFGNLFTGEGVFAGHDAILSTAQSSVRACGLQAPGAGDACLPIHHVARCSEICYPDSRNNYFLGCFRNGKGYLAMTTRIRKADVYTCGDRVCQISESCGTGFTPNNCMDCGPCP